MMEDKIVSAMWHRSRREYVPMTLVEIARKAKVPTDEVHRARRDGFISAGGELNRFGADMQIFDITEAGKRLHKATKGN